MSTSRAHQSEWLSDLNRYIRDLHGVVNQILPRRGIYRSPRQNRSSKPGLPRRIALRRFRAVM
jgi:hypothetical protein